MRNWIFPLTVRHADWFSNRNRKSFHLPIQFISISPWQWAAWDRPKHTHTHSRLFLPPQWRRKMIQTVLLLICSSVLVHCSVCVQSIPLQWIYRIFVSIYPLHQRKNNGLFETEISIFIHSFVFLIAVIILLSNIALS